MADVNIVSGLGYAVDETPVELAGWRLKRAFDVVTASVLLVLVAPVILIASLGILLSGRGPIFFRQSRVGLDGVPFTMFKLRTFPVDHVDQTHSLHSSECPLQFGRLLRRTSVDELPQLWNVLRGEMSMIGPRPERPQFAASLEVTIPGYRDRHRVPGGITGMAQVNGYWGNSSLTERTRLDNEYIDSWSFKNDAKIFFRTIPAVLSKCRRS